jgi:hypothetical protein
MKTLQWTLCMLLLIASFQVFAAERRKKIDFEDQLVEGVNRQPLDSLSQLSEDRASKKYRLYRKRAGFRDLHDGLVDELRNLQ